MIEVKRAFVRYHADERAALSDVSLTVSPAEVLSLVGANGSGKSTLASLLCALRLSDEGSVVVDGFDPASSAAARREVRRRVGFVRQHPADQLVSTSVADEVAFGPRNLGLEPDVVAARVERALARVGLEGFEGRDTGALSGGQQQLLAVAGVLAMEPSYMVLDEATSMLDASARPAMRTLVARLAHEVGLGVVQVTHDPLEILASDRVVVLEAGSVIFDGSPRRLLSDRFDLWSDTVVDDPSVRAVRACIDAGLPEQMGCEPQGAVSWAAEAHRHRQVAPDALRSIKAALRAPEAATGRGRAFAAAVDDAASDALLLDGVTFSYDGCEPVLRDIDLAVRPGEVALVAGPSGSGKSTLACVASGLFDADAGGVRVNGAPVRTGSVGIAFQRPEDQLFCESVRDELAFAPLNLGATAQEAACRAEAAARLVGLEDDLLDRYPFDLSGGQARRVAIASVLALDAGVYLLDEPTAGLDAAGRRTLHETVRACANKGCAMVVISHDLEEWLGEADRVLLMASGSVVWEGMAAELAGRADAFARAGLRAPLSFELDATLADALADGGVL